MSDIDIIDDHEAQALARVIDQFSEATRFKNLIGAIVEPVQEIEDALHQLLIARSVTTAIGAQLDILGEIVGQAREGRTDDDYRIWINARILVNRSTGTPNDSLEIMQLVEPLAVTSITDYYPASYEVESIGIQNTPAVLAEIMRAVKPAGVGFGFVYSDVVPEFVFTLDDDTTETLDTSLGLGDTSDPDTGGQLTGVI